MKISIIANGEPISKDRAHSIVQGSDYIIAADGGIISCRQNDIKPDFIIGDFDSVPRDLLEDYQDAKIIHLEDQYSTDMEKALTFAGSLHPDRILVLSAFGKRMDHTSANLLFLAEYNEKTPVTIYDNYGSMSILKEGKHILKYKPGTLISFFSPYPVKNLSLEGFQYNLQKQNYDPYFVGISNVCKQEECIVEFDSGRIFSYLVQKEN